MTGRYDPDLFSWGGPEDSRQSRLDAAYDAYEERHRGTDGGYHHRPYVPGEDLDSLPKVRAALDWLRSVEVRHDQG